MNNEVKLLIRQMYNKQMSIELKTLLSVIKTKKDYELFIDFIENYILDDYVRSFEKVQLICEKEMFIITLFQLLINLYLLEFNFLYKIPITKHSFTDIDYDFLQNYHENIESLMQEKVLPFVLKKKINQSECFSYLLSSITERIYKLTELVSIIASPTINTIDIMEFCKRDGKFANLLNTTLDESKSSSELEHELDVKGTELHDIIIKDKKSCLFPFLVSGCAKKQQVTQVFVAVGPRMSATNVVMSHVMKRSYLNGLENIGDFIAESEIALKALIYKKKFVGVSGYMSRESTLTGLNIQIDFDMEDCGTKHYVNYYIENQKYLDLIHNKNIILDNGKLHKVDKYKDKHLIGTTVKLRSICTCAHRDKRYVCKTCYGNPLDFKRNYLIGGATATDFLNDLSNAVMSVKHSTSTKTKELDNEDILNIFELDNNILSLKRSTDKLNIDKISLVFNKMYIEDIIDRLQSSDIYDSDEDMDDEEEIDESESIGTKIVSKMLTKFKIVYKSIDPVSNEEILDEFDVNLEGCFLTINKEILNMSVFKNIAIDMENNTAELFLSDIKHGTKMFNVKYITMETSKYLKDLKNIIERSKPNWFINDVDTPIKMFADLIVNSGLKGKELVFIEPIIKSLTKNLYNLLLPADFNKDEPQFVIVNLETSIFKSELTSALVYQEINKLLKDNDSYNRLDIGAGIHDPAFETSMSHDFSYMKKALKKAKLL